METPPNCDRGRWSDLPMDLLRCLLERLSFVDFHRAKMVCSNWYLCSKQTLGPKLGSPLLIMSEEEGSYHLYNPEEDRVYEAKSNYRFLGSSGKWFLFVDSRSDLYIINVFSNERIRLPPLESVKSSLYEIKRLGGDKEFNELFVEREPFSSGSFVATKDVRAVLWVDEKKGDYVVVWGSERKGMFITVRFQHVGMFDSRPKRCGTQRLQSLRPNRTELHSAPGFSGQDSFEDVSAIYWPPLSTDVFWGTRAYKVISYRNYIAVTTSGEVLMVQTIAYESTSGRNRMFHLYKEIENKIIEVDSLGDEALFLDLGITVPADHTLGIEPNSIYFSRDDHFFHKRVSCIDICVYNLATKTIKRFPSLSNFKIKDAQWFFPS